jgi:hypothetical protein
VVTRRVVLESGVATLALAGVAPRRSLRAQEPASETTVETGPQSAPQIDVLPANPQTNAPPNGTERSNMLVSAAFLLLMGIVTLGVLLLAVVLLLGSRARRLAREPLPEIPPQDRDWFLRKPLEPPGDSPPPSHD